MPDTPSDLEAWMLAAREQLPQIDVQSTDGGLVITWQKRRVDLPAARVRRFEASELNGFEGSYLDLRSGVLSIEDEGILVHVKVSAARPGLTAQLCAILAQGLLSRLDCALMKGKVRPAMLLLIGKQGQLAREWSRELDTDISTMVMNRLLAALRRAGLLDGEPRDLSELPLGPGLDLLRAEFRMNGIGRCESYRVAEGDVIHLVDALGDAIAWGTSYSLSHLAGGWVEPQDILVDPLVIGEVRRLLGPPVKRGGPHELLVRPTSRVRLALLVVDRDEGTTTRVLNPILATCDALRSSDAVKRQLASQIWEGWSKA